MPHIRRVTIVYLFGMGVCAVVLIGLNLIGERLFHTGISSAVSAVGVLVPAMFAGIAFVHRSGDRPAERELWALSLWFTLIQIAAGALLLWILDVFSSARAAGASPGMGANASWVLLILFPVLLVGSRLGLGLGVRAGLKQSGREGHG